MQRFVVVVLALAACLVCRAASPSSHLSTSLSHPASRPTTTCEACVYFSPHGGAAAALIRAIHEANTSVLVQAYSFTYEPIAEALVDAARRGVKVNVILDVNEPEEKHSVLRYLVRFGIPVSVDAKHNKAHNKVMILDDDTVITGSFNFIRDSEEENAENLLIIKSKELAEQYIKNWQYHASHSKEVTSRPAP